jgi:toxin ParE1/3/4
MRPVIWTTRAKRDLGAQIAYIAADNQTASIRVRNRLDEVAEGLSQFATGRRSRNAGTYEQIVAGLPYLIVYRIRRAAGFESIRILRVIHTPRNWTG